MPLYECNEHQFVEDLRRLIQSGEKFVVNRRAALHDDARYGPSILPNDEFARFELICNRRSVKSTVYAKIPFIDQYHGGRIHEAGENLHSSANLKYPRMSIPYYRIEYSVNVWGGTYLHSFDALFDPEIKIVRRSGKKLGKGTLIHVLDYSAPKERLLTLNLPRGVVVFDVKHMVRVIDHSSNF